MAAGDTHAADPVDTVHHEMDSAVCSHHFINLLSQNRVIHMSDFIKD